MKFRYTKPTAAALGLTLLLAACGGDDDSSDDDASAAGTQTPSDNGGGGNGGSDQTGDTGDGTETGGTDDALPADGANVAMTDANGNSIGTVTLTELDDDTVAVSARLSDLQPGFKGFHIHDTGICEADAPDGPFTTAGSHYTNGGEEHPEHAGDLPPLLVMADGTVDVTVVTDRFTVDELDDADAAVVVHDDRDNQAHIPGRYTGGHGPDQDTRNTGDAGARIACGVLTDDDGNDTADDADDPDDHNDDRDDPDDHNDDRDDPDDNDQDDRNDQDDNDRD